jgi:hypothetical protein
LLQGVKKITETITHTIYLVSLKTLLQLY